MNQNTILTILGPTASGKTALAIEVAKRIDAEIISADARQVYRSMDIGTGKDLNLYGNVPHHLIDIKHPDESYDVSQFRQDFFNVLRRIEQRDKHAILCGGSGLYIQAVLQNFNQINIPQNPTLRCALEVLEDKALIACYHTLKNRDAFIHDIGTRKRLIRAIEMGKWLEAHAMPAHTDIAPRSIIFGLNPDVALRRQRISERLQYRFNTGLIEEVAQLRMNGITDDRLVRFGLEYKWVCLYLKGDIDYSTLCKNLETNIHRFAKRQMTYFRKMEKDGLVIHWLKSDSIENQIAEIRRKQNEFL